MKKFLVFVMLIMIFLLSVLTWAQEFEKIREEVEVVNVEVPVRVYYKKKPVKGLGKKDFKLFIGGEEREIHGFYEVRKKIDTPSSRQSPRVPRLFVLIFNVTSYNLDLENGLHTLFKNVIQPNDRLMVLTNNIFLKDKVIEDPQKEKEKIIKILNIESRKMRQEFASIEFNLRYLASSFKLDIQGTGRVEPVIHRFIGEYMNYFEEFKNKFFSPNEEQYLKIAGYLKRQKIEKWVLNFYQTPMFPQLNHSNGTIYKIIDNFFRSQQDLNAYVFDVQLAMGMPDQSLVKNISKIFLNTGATFHTLLMKAYIGEFFEEYSYKPIVIDSEYISRETTKITGGSIVASNNIKKFVKKISGKEDIYYMLTYVPKKGEDKGKGKIKVKVSNEKYRTVYDDQQRPGYLKRLTKAVRMEMPQIRFREVELKEGLISTLISGIQLAPTKKNKEEKSGKIFLSVKILNDKAQKISGAKKAFTCRADKVPICLRLPSLKKGEYQMLLEVNDLLTGKNDLELKEIRNTIDHILEPGQEAFQFVRRPISDRKREMRFEEIAFGSSLMRELETNVDTSFSKKEIDPEILPRILDKVADYCKRLQATSLNFFCIEEIDEVLLKALEWRGTSRKKNNKLTYGYQLVKDKGKPREKRALFKQNGLEQVKGNAELKTRFKYKHIVYGPLIFSKKSQQFYHYEIIGKRSWKRKNVYIIEAVPKSTGVHRFVSGKFWVDEKDFSILRIEVYQSSLKNYGEIEKMAGKYHLEPRITIINEYDIIKKGVRFPSKLYYEEAYKNKKGKMIVQALGNVTFKDYQFFNIETKVTKEERKEP